MNVAHRLEAFVFVLLTGFVRLLPLSAVRRMGRALGLAGYAVVTSRRRITLSNLRLAYPSLPEAEIRRLARASFCSVGEASLELGWLARLTPEIVRHQMVITNPEELEKELRRGKGVVVVVSHYAGWEIILQGIQQYAPDRTHVVYKPLSNAMVDYAVLRWRQKLGVKWIPLGTAVTETMIAVQAGDVVVLAADQSVGPESVWTSFFGRNVPTAKGPAALCLKTGAALFLSAVRRQDDGRCVGPLVRVKSSDLKGYDPRSMRTLTQRLTSLTEEYIRKDPGQWMWTHKRWKHARARNGEQEV